MFAAKTWDAMGFDAGRSIGEAPVSFEGDLEKVGKYRDKAAFSRLFEHFAPRLKTYLRKLSASDDLCDDLVQDVMVAVWRRAPQYDSQRAAASTWIYTIARNRRIDMFRRQKYDEVEYEEYHETATAPSGFDFLSARQTEAQLQKAIADLPEKQAGLLRIFYFEDKTHSEIAAELNLPLGTVKSRLRLAMSKLRVLIEDDQS